MMTKRIVVSLVLTGTMAIGCGSPDVAQREPSTVTSNHRSNKDGATQTLGRMLKVANKGDWKAYVEGYYGEQHKFRSPADCDALVKRFEDKWAEKIVLGLNRAAKLPVRIEEEKALFLDGDDTVFVLHRAESGDWKFHL